MRRCLARLSCLAVVFSAAFTGIASAGAAAAQPGPSLHATAAVVATASSGTDSLHWQVYGHYLSLARCLEVGVTVGALSIVKDWSCDYWPECGNYTLMILVGDPVQPPPDLRGVESVCF